MAPAVCGVSTVCLIEYANVWSVCAAQRLGCADNNRPGMDCLVVFCLQWLLLHHLFWKRQASLLRCWAIITFSICNCGGKVSFCWHIISATSCFCEKYNRTFTLVLLLLLFLFFSPELRKKQSNNKNIGDSSVLLQAVSMQLRPSLDCLTGVSSLSQYRLECNPVAAEITSPPLWQMAICALVSVVACHHCQQPASKLIQFSFIDTAFVKMETVSRCSPETASTAWTSSSSSRQS